jgi:hypothetical protein
MSLTGPVFLDGIIVLTVAAALGLVVLWPRLARPSPIHVAGRAAALVLVNVLVLLTAGSQLNATYLFFADWSDLRAAMTGSYAQTSLHRGGAERRAADLAATGTVAPVARHPRALHQHVSPSGLAKYTVHGPLSGLTGRVLVELPTGYGVPGSHQRYPVLEAFHGYPSQPLSWVRVFHIGPVVQEAVAAHQLRPTIVVMPQVEFPKGVDTEGVNGPAGQAQVETWLTRDVPDWVGRHFRVVANRDAWATIGYSSGGFVAAMATILHPAQYGAGIVLGGYYRPDFGPFYEPFGPTSALSRRYDLPRVAARQRPPVSLWVQTSHADPVSYGSSAHFLAVTRPPMAVRAVVLQNVGHRDQVWTSLVPQALRWLGANVHGFAP